MSYAYRHPAKATPQLVRPRGVSILAPLGILSGLAQLLTVLLIAWLRMRGGVSLGNQLAPLALGLGLAWITVWLNWALWDMVRWAWWASVAVGAIVALAALLLFRSAPDLAALLTRGLPLATAQRFQLWLAVELIFLVAFNVVNLIYLLTAYKSFGIGVKQKRPLWER